jgi:glucose-1-phosphate adenylyltransferase
MNLEDNRRYVSGLTRETIALVLAGGRGSRLKELTQWRAKPGVYFGGKFRIIDFPLSNCVNSGIRRIGVLTQYKAHSLIRHLVHGWSGFKSELGEFVEALPASQRTSGDWYKGTADAVYQNIDIIKVHTPKFVLILAGDHVYKMDYGAMLAYHLEEDADMTVGGVEVPLEEATALGVMTVDGSGSVLRFDEKPATPQPMPRSAERALASMGIYVFNTEFLYEELIRDAQDAHSAHDFGKNIIPGLIDSRALYAYAFRDPVTGEQPFWRDVGTVDAFYEANLELVDVEPELNLYDEQWPILTHQVQLPPAKFVFAEEQRRGLALNSMVSGGCVISGVQLHRTLAFLQRQSQRVFHDRRLGTTAAGRGGQALPHTLCSGGSCLRVSRRDGHRLRPGRGRQAFPGDGQGCSAGDARNAGPVLSPEFLKTIGNTLRV